MSVQLSKMCSGDVVVRVDGQQAGYVVWQHYSKCFQPFTPQHRTMRPTDSILDAVRQLVKRGV